MHWNVYKILLQVGATEEEEEDVEEEEDANIQLTLAYPIKDTFNCTLQFKLS
jgi:hypothetical protein